MPPRPRPALSLLAQYRLALKDRPSQGWVADQISEIANDDVSQQAVGYWETGKVDLRNVHPRRLSAYAKVLGISHQQLAAAVGRTVTELFPKMTTPDESSETVEAPEPLELPDLLREAIEQYGGRFPKLKEERWQRWLANTDFREEPENAETWLAVFLDFEKKINPR